MATLEQVEKQIFEREGFRVRFVPFAPRARYAPYAHPVMAPNAWRVSDWKARRLAPYLAQIRSVEVLRDDGRPLRGSDVRLGHLRDGYAEAYERERTAREGVAPDEPARGPASEAASNVVPLRPSRRA